MGPRDRRRLARHRTSLRGSNIRPDLWSNSTNTHSPQGAVSQHASTCTGTHRQSHKHFFFFFKFPTQSPLLLFSPYLFSLSISSGPSSFPLSADVLEDDISSSPTERHGGHQSPSFSPLTGLSGDQLLSDFSAVGPPLNHSPSHAQVRKQFTFD